MAATPRRRGTMLVPAGSKMLLAAISTTVTLVLSVGAYELYRSYRYDQWRLGYTENQWIRFVTIASPNPVLVWEYRPNSESVSFNLTMNQFGFRQPRDVKLRKPADVLRIAFIGDSITLGFKVASEATFVSLVETRGQAALGDSVLETLNFGVDGYNTVQIGELLKRRVLEFDPDVVVYTMCLNDFDFEDSSGGKTRYFQKPDFFVLESLRELEKRLLFRGEDFHDYYFEKNKPVVFSVIAEMASTLSHRGIDFYVAIMPVFRGSELSFAGVIRYDLESFRDYPLTALHEEVVQTLTEEGIRTIDLLEDFDRNGASPLSVASDVWHPNDVGHRLIADSLTRSIFGLELSDQW